MISRAIEATVLRSLNFLPVVGISGPRQIGKTTLARKLIHELSKPAVYYELPITSSLTDSKTEHNYVITPNGGNVAVRPKWMHCHISELLGRLKTLDLIAKY